MKTTYVITINEHEYPKSGCINIYDTEGIEDKFTYEDFEIKEEFKETDCEDFNDNARWLAKTLLEIKKLEYYDENAHCDWTAEDNYTFNVSITKKD